MGYYDEDINLLESARNNEGLVPMQRNSIIRAQGLMREKDRKDENEKINKEKRNKFLYGVLIGAAAFGVLMTLLVEFKRSPNDINTAYQQAYRDMKANKIEDVVKSKYPALWIEFNVPIREEIK